MQDPAPIPHRTRSLTSSFGFSRDNKAGWLAKVLFWTLTCMIVISLFSLVNLYLLREVGWWRNHAHEAIEQIDETEQSVSRAAGWYQTYRFTHDPADLWRSDRELSIGQDRLHALQRETIDNPFQQEKIRELDGLLTAWFQESAVLSHTTHPFVDGTPILNSMRKQERALLLQRSLEMEAIRSTTIYMSSGMLLFSIVSLLFLWRKWNQENSWTTAVLHKLHAAEARFLAFMDHSPLPAFISDPESRLIYTNRAWDRSMGTHFDAAANETVPNEIPAPLRRHDEEILASGKTHEFLETVPTPDERSCNWLVVRFPFSSDGESTLLGGMAMDVTEFRRTQMALETSEERLRLALKSASMHVWEISIPKDEEQADLTNFTLCDDESPKNLEFSDVLQRVSPEFREGLRQAIGAAIHTRSSFQMVYRTIAGRWIASSGTVQVDEDQRPVRMIGFRQDQTDKVEAEQLLASLTKLHEAILKSTHVALISIDKNRLITSWNPAAERLLGYTARDVVGRATPDLWLDSSDIQSRAEKLGLTGHLHTDPFLSQALLNGEDTQECTFTRKDGSKILVRLTITPIFNDDGGLFGFLEHATDISEFRRASHQVQELNQALQDTVSGWATIDLEGRYITVNKSYANTVGYHPEEMIGLPWQQTVHPDDLPFMVDLYERFLSSGREEARIKGLRKDGTVFYQQISLAPAHDHLGARVGSYCFVRDVTARVEAERKLAASERRYREFFELNPLPCWTYDPQSLRFLDVNAAAVRHYGYSRDEFLAMSLSDIRLPEEAKLIERELQRFTKLPAWTSGPWHNRLRDGTLIEVEIHACNLSENARLAVIHDVTEQRQAEIIRKSEAKLQEAQHIARLGSWELDTKSGAVSWSPETYRIFGLEGSAGKFLFEEFLTLVHPEDRERVECAVSESLKQKQVYDLQFRILRQNGELRHIHGRGQFSNGSGQRLTGTMLDVTEQKRAQDALQQSLDEKELLLKEVHHRVKNNLQVISCLLNMQAANVTEEPAVAALRESERRVMAMAVIHERLYGHKRMDRINFREYAQTLTEDLILSYAPSGSEIEGHFSLQSIELNIEQAIPCGLILNELVTNCIKYAYPDDGRGSIFVNLEETPEQKLSLSVADHGQGLPANFDWRKSKSLGVTIVNLLTKQLGGSLQIKSSSAGTTFTVVFPKAS